MSAKRTVKAAEAKGIADLSREFLFEEELRQRGQEQKTQTRLRWIFEGLAEGKPELLLYFAFGKPIDLPDAGGESDSTMRGVPEDFMNALREYAKKL